MRKQFQQLFKQFRESVIILRNEAKGMLVSPHDKDTAMKNIDKEATKIGFRGMSHGHMNGMGENETSGDKTMSKRMNDNSMPDESGQHGKH